MSSNGKILHGIPEIWFFLDSNLDSRVKVFTWGVANDFDICKKTWKPYSTDSV